MANTTTSQEIMNRIYTSHCGLIVHDASPNGCKVLFYLLRTCPFLLLLIGTFGNILNIAVLSRRRIRQQPASVCLLFLACSDLMTLWASLLRSTLLRIWGIDIRKLSAVTCATQEWIAFSCAIFSLLLLAFISMERMMTTRFPLWMKAKMRQKYAVLACSILVLFCLTLGSHFLYGRRLRAVQMPAENNISVLETRWECAFVSAAYVTFYERGWALTTLAMCILLWVLIVVCNTVIVTTLAVQRRRIQPTMSISAQTGQALRGRALTRLCVFLSIYFMVSSAPYTIYVYWVQTLPPDMTEERFAYALLHYMCFYYLILSNYTMNFFFYFSSGTLFKRELTTMWFSASRKMPRLFGPRGSQTQTVRTSGITRESTI